MGRIEKTVFISYRRTNLPWALFIYQNLTMHGFDVFFDYQSIDSGNFEKVILDNIRARAHFMIVLTPSALENCKNPGDWLRREIETAMDENRNIVPLMVENFDFGSPFVKEALTGKLAALSSYNGLSVPNAYALEAMERLRERYLNKALSDVPTPVLQLEAQKITEIQKTAANEAPPVQDQQLTAQTWYERGYTFHNAKSFDEAIRCYTEAIRIEPKFDIAYLSRGLTLYKMGDLSGAISDYENAIQLKSDPLYYLARSSAYLDKNDFESAIADCNKAIQIEPGNASAYYFRGDAYFEKRDIDSAIADYTEAIRLDPSHDTAYYNRADAWEKKKVFSKAIADYENYLELSMGKKGDQAKVEEIIRKLKSKLAKKKSTKKKTK
jgi:tetratricopeptide (TPR) repeat protein